MAPCLHAAFFLGFITILYAARLPIQHACVVMYCAVCVVNTDGGRRPGAALQMQCGRAGPPGTAQPGKVEWALPYCETISSVSTPRMHFRMPVLVAGFCTQDRSYAFLQPCRMLDT